MDPDLLFRVVDVTGVIANGLLGAAAARRHNYDIIGFFVLGGASALGGGLLRDMMLTRDFPVALTDPWYLSGAFGAAFIGYFFTFEHKWTRRMLVLADALALGCWSATGASKGLTAGLGWFPAIFLGVVTAVCGGMIRDVLCKETPAIFGGKPIYATLAVVASTQMVIWQTYGYATIGMACAIILCSVFSLIARRKKWILPTHAYDLASTARGHWPRKQRFPRDRRRRIRHSAHSHPRTAEHQRVCEHPRDPEHQNHKNSY
ncbi:MAG: TRIC cation channel family protein [Actinomycetaceae bacterium]|nr:TRIC cation channel family protein [Actinomycetaceae bacterium]MDY5854752.1 TRIC cation channel family protein [Arcanobacterium sp.]